MNRMRTFSCHPGASKKIGYAFDKLAQPAPISFAASLDIGVVIETRLRASAAAAGTRFLHPSESPCRAGSSSKPVTRISLLAQADPGPLAYGTLHRWERSRIRFVNVRVIAVAGAGR